MVFCQVTHAELGGNLQVKATDEWLLGVASKNAPTTNGRFIGLLDDMRFYCSTSSEQLAKKHTTVATGTYRYLWMLIFPQYP